MTQFNCAFQDPEIRLFSTCSSLTTQVEGDHRRRIIDVARWSEECGCDGILIYADHSELDPWLVAQIILENTSSICPFVAVQPAYMHPLTVAKIITSLGFLYGRRIHLNLIAGGFKNDLTAIDDSTKHDERYDRLIEYASIVRNLLAEPSPKTFSGKYYTIRNLTLSPQLPSHLLPEMFVSGSSPAGLAAARLLKATIVQYPVNGADRPPSDLRAGCRIGVITRQTSEEAWHTAHTRFPQDRRGRFMHKLAMKVTDSTWHQQLSALPEEANGRAQPYWLSPFNNNQSMCPYLVGDHESVAREISACIARGYKTFILDIPETRDDLEHAAAAFALICSERKESVL